MVRERLTHAAKVVVRKSFLAPALRRAFRRRLLEPAIQRGRAHGWDAAASWFLSPAGASLRNSAGWHRALRRGINVDIDTELLLTAVRRRLVLAGIRWWEDPELGEVAATLLQQCINNEFVWYASKSERVALSTTLVVGAQQPAWVRLALRCMYDRPERVVAHEWAAAAALGAMPDGLRRLVRSALDEAEERKRLGQSIRCFGSSTADADEQVAALYEEYPYPRWLDWDIPPRGARRRRLAALLRDEVLSDDTRELRVLVAGCGTGSKAIAHAFGYGANARVTGVDLSRASLGYAAMMAARYGAANIDWIRMNLLELPELGEQFDVVECTGVLHHLPDPEAGARALAAVTRPGGFAHVSVYSEAARREVVRLRRAHESRIAEITDDDVRAFRWRLMQDDPASIDERLCLRSDFFDLVRCRDLLFHPLEHRYAVPSAVALLESAGLEFLHIEPPPLPNGRAMVKYPSDDDARDPMAWHQFEQRYPEAFGNLYEIWARRPS